jgi:recombination protein RecT
MTAVATVQFRPMLTTHADKLAAFGVSPEAYIEAAMMATVKNPALLKCTPDSVMLALRQCAQTGLDIGRTAHLVPYGDVCTFIPDYKGLIELAIATHKVVSIRTRCVYEGEEFTYSETGAGPDIRHVPRTTGKGGVIVGAYAIADLRFNRFKVEYMSVEEIEAVRSKSKSWKNGPLEDWYGRKTVVRRLCKTLPSSPRLQAALQHDDAEELIADGEFEVQRETPINAKPRAIPAPAAGTYGAGPDVSMPDEETALRNARRGAATADPYDDQERVA